MISWSKTVTNWGWDGENTRRQKLKGCPNSAFGVGVFPLFLLKFEESFSPQAKSGSFAMHLHKETSAGFLTQSKTRASYEQAEAQKSKGE